MSRLRRSVLEIVANSPLGQNMLRLGRIFFELFAQPPDMHVHRADLAADVVAPDRVEQRLARIYAVGIAHQKLHEVEFLRRQIDRHVLAKRAAAAAVKRDVPDKRLVKYQCD